MIWAQILDDKHHVYVERKSPHIGQLNIAVGRTVVYSQNVFLRQGDDADADPEDINVWLEICQIYLGEPK
jgi:hypothetical protein